MDENEIITIIAFYVTLGLGVAALVYLMTRRLRQRLKRIEKSFTPSDRLATMESVQEVAVVAQTAAAIAQDALARGAATVDEMEAQDANIEKIRLTQVEALRTLATLNAESGLHAASLRTLMDEIGIEMPRPEDPASELVEEGDDPDFTVEEILSEGDSVAPRSE